MSTEVILSVAATGLLVAGISFFLWRRASAGVISQLHGRESEIQDLSRKLYAAEQEYLAEKNRIELKHQDDLRTARAAALEEGRSLGREESRSEHIKTLTDQQASWAERLQEGRKQSYQEGYDHARAEAELQSKLFDVKISPYVEVAAAKGMFRSQEEVRAGYQYQLLVNGIPAFQPHVIIERREVSSKANEENIKAMVNFAADAAKGAISLYLGGGSRFVKLGAPIVKRLVKK